MRLELVHLLIIFLEVLSLLLVLGGDTIGLMGQRLLCVPVAMLLYQ
jgi:hypothetical protein